MTLDAADQRLVIDLAGDVAREMLRNLARGTGGAVIPMPTVRPATVYAVAPPGADTSVRADGDTDPVPAINATGAVLASGDRVLVSWLPPAGVYVTSMLGYANSNVVAKTTWDFNTPAIALTDVVSVSWEAPANRVYRYTICGHHYSNVLNDVTRLWVTDAANVAHGDPQATDYVCPLVGIGDAFTSIRHDDNVTAGHTYRKLRIQRAAGTGVVNFYAGANQDGLFMVEDIGPVT